MFKYLIIIIASISLLVSCGANNDKVNEETEQKVEEIQFINIAEFDTKAGDFVDKKVKVSGICDHICKHGGKRLFIVSDEANLHIEGEERFDEDLMGKELEITGIVREFRVDEAYCIQMEEDAIKKHKEGDADEDFLERRNNEIAEYREEMKANNVDHLSFYSLDYVSHKEVK